MTIATDRYGYDDTSRVTSGPITGTTGNPTYAYGPTGAITKATTHFTSAGYAPNGQLCWTSFATVAVPSCASPPPASSSPPTPAPTTFTYDQNGNRTSSTSPTTSSALTWQATSGRLICINTSGTTCSTSSPSATSTLYSYDGEGHRMSSSNNGTTNTFTWDTAASQLLADSTHNYLYLSGSASPDLQINLATGTVDLLTEDHNANTRGVVQVTGATSSRNGTLVNYTDYDAYGNPITESGGATNPGGMANGGVTTDTSTSFAFGAGYSDSSSLTYLVHRYLDNETGQFISIDPLVDQTREAYVYAGDGPTISADSLGEYSYNFDWNLGMYSSNKNFTRNSVFAFFMRHIADTFPFPISCETITKVGQSCILKPSPCCTTDKLHVAELVANNKVKSPNQKGSDYWLFGFEGGSRL